MVSQQNISGMDLFLTCIEKIVSVCNEQYAVICVKNLNIAISLDVIYSVTLKLKMIAFTRIQGSLFASDIEMCIGICLGDVTFTRK